jgi:LacI family repressor for deo operon, udp, cdd, tsx, nupC, and nupG
MEHLYALGHVRIAVITGPLVSPLSRDRLQGVTARARAGGAENELIVRHGDFSLESGASLADSLLERADRPTALFCFNDRIAMGAYRAIRLRGLRVPDDVSVVGFDNMEQIAPWLDPPLTTMQLPHYEMGRWAVEHVLGQPAGQLGQPVQQRLPCPLVARDSVGPPPG